MTVISGYPQARQAEENYLNARTSTMKRSNDPAKKSGLFLTEDLLLRNLKKEEKYLG